jgi:WD40 repeat protein
LPWRIPRFTTLQLLLAAALCALLLGLGTASWRATSFAQVTAVKFSPGGQYLAAKYTTGAIQVWEVTGPKPQLAMQVAASTPWNFSEGKIHFADEHTLIDVVDAADGRRGHVISLDVRDGTRERRMSYPAGTYYLLDARGDTVALLDGGTGKIVCYSLRDRAYLKPIARPHPNVSLSPDGSLLLVPDELGTITLYDVRTGQVLRSVPVSGIPMRCVLSPNGKWLAFSYYKSTLAPGDTVQLIELDSGGSWKFGTDEGVDHTQWLEFDADSSKLAVGGQGGAMLVDVQSQRFLGQIILPEQSDHYAVFPFGVAFHSGPAPNHFSLSPDATRLATFDGSDVLLWDTASGNLATRIRDHSRTVEVVLFTVFFAAWSATWGIVARRNVERETKVAEAAGIQNGLQAEATAGTPPSSATSKQPLEIKLSWGLMVIGGFVAIAWPIMLFMHTGPVQWPMMYVSLFTGIAAMAKGAGRQTTGLSWVAKAQVANLLACDPINFVLGTLAFALLKRPHVQRYLTLANDLARPLR